MDITIDTEQFADDDLSPGLRERLLRSPGRLMDRIKGDEPTCTSDVTLTFMASLTESYTSEGFCLDYTGDDVGYVMVPGEQNFRGRCERTTCQRVDMASDELKQVQDNMTHVFGQPPTPGEIRRAETFGAKLLQGSDRFLRTQANGAASVALTAALGTPAIAAAGIVTLVAVEGSAFLCRD